MRIVRVCNVWLIVGVTLAVAPIASGADRSPTADRLMKGLPLTYLHAIGRDLARELKFDDEQIETLAVIVESHQTAITADRRDARRLRNLMRQRDEAVAANSATNLARIDDEIAELQAKRAAFREEGDPFTNFFDDIRSATDDNIATRITQFEQRLIENRFYGPTVRQTLEQLPATLSLTSDQRRVYDELRATLIGKAPRPRWNIATVRPASERSPAGPLRSTQPAEETAMGALQQFFADLEAVLTADQQLELADVRATITETTHEPPTDTRLMFRAVKRIDLDKDQSEKIRTLEREARKAMRAAKRDEAAKAKVASMMQAKISAVLTPAQRGEFEKRLADLRDR